MLGFRRLDGDGQLLDPGIERHRRGLGLAAQQLMPGLGLGRHGPDHRVVDQPGLAGQPEPLAHLLVAELNVVGDRGRGQGAGDHLAAARPAAPALAAGGGDLDPGPVGGVQQGLTPFRRDGALAPVLADPEFDRLVQSFKPRLRASRPPAGAPVSPPPSHPCPSRRRRIPRPIPGSWAHRRSGYGPCRGDRPSGIPRW